jgi:hypothetical protein
MKSLELSKHVEKIIESSLNTIYWFIVYITVM